MSNYLDNLELFDSKIIQKGRTYYKEKRVHFSSLSPTSAIATVYGGSHYEVKLQFDPEHDLISATCTCGEGGFCKHMVATLYEISDQFALGSNAESKEEEGEKGNALVSAVEDIKNSVFRFNYKGLSKAMEVFISLLPKACKEGRAKGVKTLFESFLSRGKYPIDYDRLTPYIREILRKGEFERDEMVELYYELLKDHMNSDALWTIMTKEGESCLPFQIAAAKRMKEGYHEPHHLSSFAPLTSWACVDPELLEELLNSPSFHLKEEDMAALIKSSEAKKNLDITIELFRTAVRYYDGFLLDPSVLTTLMASEEHREKLESIFYDEFSLQPSCEKYLLWKSVAVDDDFEKRFLGHIEEIESPTKDFIMACEGRGKVGDIYDSLDVRNVPFELLGFAVDKVEEDAIIQQFLDYGKEEEREILRNLEKKQEAFRTLLRIYGKFGRYELGKIIVNPLVLEVAAEDPVLRGKILVEAYKNNLLDKLGCKLYRE
ncbi:MAG: SWIM zinc finger family protein [Bacilli bacterium]|nr:SWIM zinc finger family protein [Bacilli bacterium]